MLTLSDPEGFPVNLIYGQEPREAGEYPTSIIVNTDSEKPRIRKFQRFNPGPAAVHKVRFRPYSWPLNINTDKQTSSDTSGSVFRSSTN